MKGVESHCIRRILFKMGKQKVYMCFRIIWFVAHTVMHALSFVVSVYMYKKYVLYHIVKAKEI